METIFAIVLIFPSWDNCVAAYYAPDFPRGVTSETYICPPVERERVLAPSRSLRPQARKETE